MLKMGVLKGGVLFLFSRKQAKMSGNNSLTYICISSWRRWRDSTLRLSTSWSDEEIQTEHGLDAAYEKPQNTSILFKEEMASRFHGNPGTRSILAKTLDDGTGLARFKFSVVPRSRLLFHGLDNNFLLINCIINYIIHYKFSSINLCIEMVNNEENKLSLICAYFWV